MYSAGQTIPSTAQIRAEGNNKKCVGKKRFNGSVTHGLRKEHVLCSPPSHFGQGKIIYANRLHDTLPEFANTSNFLSDIGLTECKFLPVPQKSWWSYNL